MPALSPGVWRVTPPDFFLPYPPTEPRLRRKAHLSSPVLSTIGLGGCPMTTWEIIAEKAKDLPADKQQEVLDFVEFVRIRTPQKDRLESPAGLLADLGVD